MSNRSPLEVPDSPHFTVVVLPDTQRYSQDYPDRFEAQTRWIEANVEDEHVAFIVHEGDVVDAPTDEQFERADRAIRVLDDGDVPYLVAIGNHDYDDVTERQSSTFDRYFPRSRVADRPWWGGSYDGTAYNAYARFEVLGEDYLVLALEFFPRDEVCSWAADVLRAHADRRAMIVTHGYLYTDGTPIDVDDQWDRTVYDLAGNNGDELWDGFLSQHENLLAVFSGHVLFEGSAFRTTPGQNGNLVHQVVTNYQTLDDGGRGYLRLVRFFPTEGTITVESYSPFLDAYHEDPDHHVRIDDAF